jgi:hypothetical protein
MTQLGEHLVITSGFTPIVLTSTGNKWGYASMVPFDLVRWGFGVTTAFAVDACVVACDKRIAIGSDAGRIDAAGGTISNAAVIAIGQVQYHEPTSRLEVNPGQELVFECTDLNTTAAVVFLLEIQLRPFQEGGARLPVSTRKTS